MLRPSFRVVTGTVCVLAAIGFATKALKPHIPSTNANRLGLEKAEYLLAGSAQPIRWRKLSPEVLAEAKRRQKPIFIAIGKPNSSLANRIDAEAFSHSDVSRFLNRNFVPVRIDVNEEPYWAQAYLPVTRLQTRISNGLQMVVLDPKGRLIDALPITTAWQFVGQEAVVNFLVRATKEFERAVLDPNYLPSASTNQRLDLAQIEFPTGAPLPDFERHANSVWSTYIPQKGLFGIQGFGLLSPGSIRFLAMYASDLQWLVPIRRQTTSPLFDVVDGGWFRLALLAPPETIDISKSSLANADQAEVLAIGACLASDARLGAFADATAAATLREFSTDDGWASGRSDDFLANFRSPRYSLSRRRLVNDLTSSEQEWVTKFLLRNETTGQALGALPDRYMPTDPTFLAIQQKLAASGTPKPLLRTFGRTDVTGYVLARLINVARLRGDSQLLEQLGAGVDQLLMVVSKSGVENRLGESQFVRSFLGSDLAVADACLSDYLTTGRISSLEIGWQVLRAAKKRYVSEAGLWKSTVSSTAMPLEWSPALVELADDERQSLQAIAMRLALSYGRLYGQTTAGRDMIAAANDAMSRVAGLTENASINASSFFAASLEVLDDRFVVCVGLDAVEMATRLARSIPTRLVAPLVGAVRDDIQRRGKGAYIVSKEAIVGPLSEAEVTKRLSPKLNPNR